MGFFKNLLVRLNDTVFGEVPSLGSWPATVDYKGDYVSVTVAAPPQGTMITPQWTLTTSPVPVPAMPVGGGDVSWRVFGPSGAGGYFVSPEMADTLQEFYGNNATPYGSLVVTERALGESRQPVADRDTRMVPEPGPRAVQIGGRV